MPYIVVRALWPFSKREELLKLAKKVEVKVDPEINKVAPEKRGALVEIFTRREVYKWTVENPLGEPENPLSDQKLKNKFKMLTKPVLGLSLSEKIIQNVELLQKIKNLKEFINILSPPHDCES